MPEINNLEEYKAYKVQVLIDLGCSNAITKETGYKIYKEMSELKINMIAKKLFAQCKNEIQVDNYARKIFM